MIELKLIPISIGELKPLIRFSYEGDTDLIEKYQAGDRCFEDCVEFNYEEIKNHLSDNYKDSMKLWRIGLDGGHEIHSIGYCVTVGKDESLKMLLSFAINIRYRKKELLIEWLKAIEKQIGEPYYTCLWNKNTRAIDFFKKNGFDEMQSGDGTFKYMAKGFNDALKHRLSWQ